MVSLLLEMLPMYLRLSGPMDERIVCNLLLYHPGCFDHVVSQLGPVKVLQQCFSATAANELVEKLLDKVWEFRGEEGVGLKSALFALRNGFWDYFDELVLGKED